MRVCPNCGEENPERFPLCGFCGTQLAPELPPQEVRKTVTIVFSDLKGSTNLGEALDSESLREVMSRYFDEMRAVLEHHGGMVEKYIGDAIMAVFGLPRLHEDDALRAVRAAASMQETLAALNVELKERWGVELTNRTGVNTGEIVAGDPSLGQRLVTGDAVNVAARLEQAAPANEILIGDSTYRLVRDGVHVEDVEPLELKGRRRGQVETRRGVRTQSGSIRRCAARALSLVWPRHHLLADRRNRAPSKRHPRGRPAGTGAAADCGDPGRGCRRSRPGGRNRGALRARIPPRRALLGRSETPRDPRASRAPRRALRRRPLGRAHVARPDRARGRVFV
ncbi:MAG: hypothetical protein E6G25_03855 [Actinobacteria bacterium]|nr:MAG: hypothetical protein E6G25_03855 [Actinomycetota bacterium]